MFIVLCLVVCLIGTVIVCSPKDKFVNRNSVIWNHGSYPGIANTNTDSVASTISRQMEPSAPYENNYYDEREMNVYGDILGKQIEIVRVGSKMMIQLPNGQRVKVRVVDDEDEEQEEEKIEEEVTLF